MPQSCTQAVSLHRFNPTMVRLLPLRSVSMIAEYWFQSHNGAIAAHRRRRLPACNPCVSIPQWCDCCIHEPPLTPLEVSSFNPTMVRLLHKCRKGCWWFVCSFNPTMVRLLQFWTLWTSHCQKVSIPQWCDCCTQFVTSSASISSCFNPTMVRLLHDAADRPIAVFGEVSIPQWCDCCGSQPCA